jgi:4-amino-4-deoxy-L-arabinose transferase-like glycosyltransferase
VKQDNKLFGLPTQVFLIVIGAVLLIPGLGKVHLLDWDEINFAESAREMLVSGDWLTVQIGFEPFWEKPPVFIWLQALCMRIFGIGEFAARLPNAIFGILTLLTVYRIGRKIHGESFGKWWALAYLGSILPHLYARSGIIDPVFNLFIFIGLYQFYRGYISHFADHLGVPATPARMHSPASRSGYPLQPDMGESQPEGKSFQPISGVRFYPSREAFWSTIWPYLLAGLFTGLAVLTKGPVAWLIMGLSLGVYWISTRFKAPLPLLGLFSWLISSCLVAGLWFLAIALVHGPELISDFVTYQIRLFSTKDSGHGGFFGYHFVVLLFGCFPASILALRQLISTQKQQNDLFTIWMQCLFWTVLILFSIVGTKIVHYSSMCYLPLAYLAAKELNQANLSRWQQRWIGIQGIVMGLLIAALPYLAMQTAWLQQILAKDPFAVENLKVAAGWAGWRGIGGWFLMIMSIAGLLYMSKNKHKKSKELYLLGTACFVTLTLFGIIRPIERHSQGGLIAMLETEAQKTPRPIIAPTGFKSFAHLFYGQQEPGTSFMEGYKLIDLKTDRTKYIIAKVPKVDQEVAYYQAKVVVDTGGYVLLKLRPF